MTITMIYDPLILQVQEFVFMVGNERCNARTLRKVSRRSERPADANHASGVTDWYGGFDINVSRKKLSDLTDYFLVCPSIC